MNHETDIDLIEKYLNHELSAEEKADLDRRMPEDDDLTREFRRRQIAHMAIDYLATQNLREELRSMENAEAKTAPIRKLSVSRIMVWSAAACALLVAGYFFLFSRSHQQDGALLAEAYYELPDYSIRGAAEETYSKSILDSGVTALKNKNYSQAISHFDSIPAADRYYLMAQYYKAHAHYQMKQWDKAREEFTAVATGKDIRIREDAEWYAALACLSQQQDCLSPIEAIAKSKGHAHHDQAAELLKQLK